MISLESSRSDISSELDSMRRGILECGGAKFAANIVAESFALSDVDEMNSELFMIEDTEALPRFRIWLEIQQNTLDESCLSF